MAVVEAADAAAVVAGAQAQVRRSEKTANHLHDSTGLARDEDADPGDEQVRLPWSTRRPSGLNLNHSSTVACPKQHPLEATPTSRGSGLLGLALRVWMEGGRKP